MGEGGEVFVGIDVAKMRNAVAIADGGRGGEVRYVGEVEASDESMAPSVPVSASRLQVRATD
jgi:transposase